MKFTIPLPTYRWLSFRRGTLKIWMLRISTACFCVTSLAPVFAEVRSNPFVQAVQTKPEASANWYQPAESNTSHSDQQVSASTASPTRLPKVPTTARIEAPRPRLPAKHDADQPTAFVEPSSMDVTRSNFAAQSASMAIPANPMPVTIDINAMLATCLDSREHEASTGRPDPANWLRSTTAQSTFRQGRVLLDQARIEYGVGAWASAEASCWQALFLFAESSDLVRAESLAGEPSQSSESKRSTIESLRMARTAIREARDFSGLSSEVDGITLERIIRSHDTNLLHHHRVANLIPSAASDRYLDQARIQLSPLATEFSDAAAAMDLLAAIQLGRNEPTLLPGPVALCLRRAALQGQPRNASLATRLGMQLADTGLNDEAFLVLQHAFELNPSEELFQAITSMARRTGKPTPLLDAVSSTTSNLAGKQHPEVIQLSPSEFAAISRPVMQVAATEAPRRANLSPSIEARHDSTSAQEGDSGEAHDTKPSSPIKRLTSSIGRLWK